MISLQGCLYLGIMSFETFWLLWYLWNFLVKHSDTLGMSKCLVNKVSARSSSSWERNVDAQLVCGCRWTRSKSSFKTASQEFHKDWLCSDAVYALSPSCNQLGVMALQLLLCPAVIRPCFYFPLYPFFCLPPPLTGCNAGIRYSWLFVLKGKDDVGEE